MKSCINGAFVIFNWLLASVWWNAFLCSSQQQITSNNCHCNWYAIIITKWPFRKRAIIQMFPLISENWIHFWKLLNKLLIRAVLCLYGKVLLMCWKYDVNTKYISHFFFSSSFYFDLQLFDTRSNDHILRFGYITGRCFTFKMKFYFKENIVWASADAHICSAFYSDLFSIQKEVDFNQKQLNIDITWIRYIC